MWSMGVAFAAIGAITILGAHAATPVRSPVIATKGTITSSATFTDSFASAVNADPSYGLNDSLTVRQTGSQSSTYTRVAGIATATTPQPWYSQANHPSYPGKLSFWLGTSAVRVDKPVVAGGNGTVSASATLDPITNDTSSMDWSSLVFDTNPGASGFITNGDVSLGALVRSQGGVQVFQGGTLVGAYTAAPAADGSYKMTLSFAPNATAATITVNGSSWIVTLNKAMPAQNMLFLGTYLENQNQVSTLTNLSASALNETPQANINVGAASESSALKYYGYYAARLTNSGGNHVPEVQGRSNLNWVNISDPDAYRPQALQSCAPGSCVVYTGNEFFSCDNTGFACSLYSNYQARWQNLANAVQPYINQIGAFYLLDEPQYHGATAAQLQTAAQTIKNTFPNAKVMMVEAGPAVTSSLVVPTNIDWVGFDWYCKPISTISSTLKTLETRMNSSQSAFLLPEDAPLAECGGVSGHATDADIASLQYQYYQLATSDSRVIGLMNFGFWTSQDWTKSGAVGASSLPQTVDANERVAARILLPQ